MRTKKDETPKRKIIKDEMLKEAERAAAHISELVERNELEPYLDGVDINGEMVEDSRDITPEQVAILGAYTMAIQMRDNLKRIMEGKPAKIKSDTKIEVRAVEIKDGKAKEVDMKNIPPEIRDALRKIINGDEDNE